MKNGFYIELDEVKKEYPEATFGFMECAVTLGRFNAFDFLHGYCLDFALLLSDELGYQLETVRDPAGALIHAYCISEVDGEKLYIDVRGITNDADLFFKEFEDEVDYSDGEFWCLDDQAFIETFINSESYLKAHPEKDLFLHYAKDVYEWNWDYYDVWTDEVIYMLVQEREQTVMSKFFVEIVQDMDGTYYANMIVAGTPVRGLPEHVDYNTLREAIRSQTGIEILKRRDMQFQQSGRKKYAYIDATQYRGEGKDCRVTLDEMRAGWKPDFTDSESSLQPDKKLSLDDQIKAAAAKYYSAPASIRRSAHER